MTDQLQDSLQLMCPVAAAWLFQGGATVMKRQTKANELGETRGCMKAAWDLL